MMQARPNVGAPDPTRSVVEDDNMRPNSDPTDAAPDQTRDPTPAPDTVLQEAVPIPLAAERLGLTSEAIRMRLKRGTLTGEKVDGRWVVNVPRLNADPTATKPPPEHDQDAEQGQTQRATQRDQSGERELIEALRSENAFLRSELATRTEEIQRRDHIIAGFIQRLPELPAGQSDPGPRAAQPETIDEAQFGPVQGTAAATLTNTRSWWKKLLGMT
jgi:hypothetical protein